ncbi:fasciclin domain-containing protein [Hymenobacter sp. 15J16-1T3B]|uniref:fasciclin domain-containing protein n=1 Tax=Hymenobacter sp. 15J16-1T3B TaxID=2886941 RepID=UPI001D11AE75|nr:fasciclin domain-containing protein [Hymenobacter sp. 15J16-1T3B]MCC3156899.1 fasciclin domain-containing protein [Hymenobacter sp. 15J16-1T3B]
MRIRFTPLLALLPLLAACNSQPETTNPDGADVAAADSAAYDPNASSDSLRMGKTGGVEVGGKLLTPDKTLAENLAATPELSQLLAAARKTDVADKLAGDGPYTVFAPSNAAFKGLPYGAMAGLLKPESKENLTGLLGYHIIQSRLLALDLRDGQEITTMEGHKLKISVQGDNITVNGAKVTTPDAVSKNGIIHVIDKVLLPPSE